MIKEFRFEWTLKPAMEARYFLLTPSFRVSGQASLIDEGRVVEGISVASSALERSIQAKLSENLRVKLKTKIDQATLQEIIDAIKKPGETPAKRIFAALGKSLGVDVGRNEPLGNGVATEVGAGVQASPEKLVYFSSKWTVTDTVDLPEPARFTANLDGRLYIGLSKDGWKEVVRRVGRGALEQVLSRSGAHLQSVGSWLVSSGLLGVSAIAVAAIGATIGLLEFTRWVVEGAYRKAAIRATEAWYISSYTAKVFGESRPSGYFSTVASPDMPRLVSRAIELGERDAVSDARITAKTMFSDPDYSAAPDDAILLRHRNRLERGARSRDNAKHQLKQALSAKAREAFSHL